MRNFEAFTQQLLANGIEEEEQARLIAEAIGRGRHVDRTTTTLETHALRSIRRTFFSSLNQGKDYKAYQKLVNDELLQLTPQEIAFGDLPDSLREQQSAFCWAMYHGHQKRFLDRHEDETVHDYLNRPQKATVNVTAVCIDTLSQLYHSPPVRAFVNEEELSDEVKDRLATIWGGNLFHLAMQDADRFTRLLGTVAIRPMYDPTVPGGIRLWLYMSHQLRVIVDPAKPWRPAAVIERMHPFGKHQGESICVWTDTYFVKVKGATIEGVPHELGRIPHVFCRDALSYNSFFVEGRGRTLCEPNATLNNDLSDFHEIKQMQGFSVMELVNPTEDDQRIGPRQAFVFNPEDAARPFGINFKAPSAPLRELAEDLDRQIKRIFLTNGVPIAVVSASLGERTMSGAAIRAAAKPLTDDLEKREALFEPIENDLADSMLRIVRRHEPSFAYTGDVKPEVNVTYADLTFPTDVRDQTVRDDFEIAQGISTPPGIMRRDNPDLYQTEEQAIEAWHENLQIMATAPAPLPDTDNEDLQASYGWPTARGNDRAVPTDDTDVLPPLPEHAASEGSTLFGLLDAAGHVTQE